MPTTEQILALLASTAQSWQHAAAFWHLYLGAFIAALVFGARPPARFCGLFLAPPILGVGAAAWMSGNPFNGVVFSLLGAAVALMSLKLPKAAVRLSSAGARLAGVVLLTFGWIYPHFLETSSWLTYLHAAPVGVIPCATLSAVIGLTLILNGLGSRRLALTLGIVGTVYGATGVLQLGVIIDLILLAGAAALLVLGVRGRLCLRGRSLAAAPAGGDRRAGSFPFSAGRDQAAASRRQP